MGAWVSIRNLAVQARTNADMERLKAVLGQRLPAYKELFVAALGYYRMLAPLETGQFDVTAVEPAETAMKQAEGSILFVDLEYQQCWSNFWQLARYTKERAQQVGDDADARIKLWREGVTDLAAPLEEMRAIAMDRFLP